MEATSNRISSGLHLEIAALADLSRAELKRRWQALVGKPPPRLSTALLTRAIAYRLQTDALGGLKPSQRRQLSRAAEEIAVGRKPPTAAPALKPATRLIREWRGITHEVVVVEDGFRYGGKVWRSLSAVARHITGTPRSGPAFFGLKQ